MNDLKKIHFKNSSIKHNSMFIVISVHPTDKDCCDSGIFEFYFGFEFILLI